MSDGRDFVSKRYSDEVGSALQKDAELTRLYHNYCAVIADRSFSPDAATEVCSKWRARAYDVCWELRLRIEQEATSW
jgi:hypothetical protein